jgi:hypothetical protein
MGGESGEEVLDNGGCVLENDGIQYLKGFRYVGPGLMG